MLWTLVWDTIMIMEYLIIHISEQDEFTEQVVVWDVLLEVVPDSKKHQLPAEVIPEAVVAGVAMEAEAVRLPSVTPTVYYVFIKKIQG